MIRTPFAVAAAMFLAACGTTETVEIVREPTEAELTAVCGDGQATLDDLGTAQTRVADLERQAAVREREVHDLETRISKGAENGGAMRRELEKVKAELADVKEKLVVAEAEKTKLLDELKATESELKDTQVVLAKTKEERNEAREDALYNRWQKFLAGAQLDICDKGNRKKLGGCREAVTAELAQKSSQDRFAHCIRSGQAAPRVAEQESAENALPQFASLMSEDVKQVKGWYVEYCDPTLPERVDAPLAEKHLPPATASQG